MLNLKEHKQFLWNYMITYGKLETDKNTMLTIFPFLDIQMQPNTTIEDYKTEELKQKIDTCQSIVDLYDLVSLPYKGFYFMEISLLLQDDIDTYSILLKKTFDVCGSQGYITKKNYQFLISYANHDVKEYILQSLS